MKQGFDHANILTLSLLQICAKGFKKSSISTALKSWILIIVKVLLHKFYVEELDSLCSFWGFNVLTRMSYITYIATLKSANHFFNPENLRWMADCQSEYCSFSYE